MSPNQYPYQPHEAVSPVMRHNSRPSHNNASQVSAGFSHAPSYLGPHAEDALHDRVFQGLVTLNVPRQREASPTSSQAGSVSPTADVADARLTGARRVVKIQ